MAHIRARIPNFVSTDEPTPEADFDSVEELLEIDFVKRVSGYNGFLKYGVSKNRDFLMAKFKDYDFCIGYLTDAQQVVNSLHVI